MKAGIMKVARKTVLFITFALVISTISTLAEETQKRASKQREAAVESNKQAESKVYRKASKETATDYQYRDRTKDTASKEKPVEAKATDKKDAEVDKADQISGQKADRITVLESKLAELDDAKDNQDEEMLDGNPHAERLRDPESIKDAIEQLKQGEDICTRCLMACGAAS